MCCTLPANRLSDSLLGNCVVRGAGACGTAVVGAVGVPHVLHMPLLSTEHLKDKVMLQPLCLDLWPNCRIFNTKTTIQEH